MAGVVELTFPKSRRLLNSQQFQQVFSHAPIKVSHPQLLILARPNALDFPRLGLVIAKKHVRTAVNRNRIKRRIRECFRLKQHKLSGIDAIVLARSGLGQLDDGELTQLVEQQFVRLLRKSQHSGIPTDKSCDI